MAENTPIFSLGSPGQFLVDGTGGVAPQPNWRQAQRGVTAATLLDRQGNVVLDLIGQVAEAKLKAEQAAEQEKLATATGNLTQFGSLNLMSRSSAGGLQAFGPLESQTASTALWLEVPTNALAAANQFAVILHNTITGEAYDFLTKQALPAPAWNVEQSGLIAATNIITTQLFRNGRTNLFVWARYAGDSTGSGMPDWWLMQYFGTTDVDPYGDPDNDGWNNLQEYQNGTSPVVFNTPPPPRNLTATLSGTNVTLSWESGGVTPTQFGIVKNGTELTRISGTILTYSGVAYSVNNYFYPYGEPEPAFQIRAYHSSGYSQSQVATVAKPSLALSADLIRGPQGQIYCSIASPPAGLSFVRFYGSTHSTPLWHDVSGTNLVNGVMTIPTNAWPLSFLTNNLPWSVKAFTTNGNFGAAAYAPLFTDAIFWDDEDGVFKFVDARRQMKENLIFLLRSASASRPFRYGSEDWTWGAPYEWMDGLFNDYTFYGFHIFKPYDGVFEGNYAPIDEVRPVYEHFVWRNFVFNTVDVTNATISNGVRGNGFEDGNGDWQPFFAFYPQPKYQYPGTGYESPLPLAFTNATSTWLMFSDFFWDDPDLMPELGMSGSYTNLSFAANTRNFFGLPISSLHFHQPGSGFVTMTGGQSGGNIDNHISLNKLFVEVAQPQLSAVSYYFGSQTPYFNNYQYSQFPSMVGPAIPMPGSPSFASTNTSPLLVTGIGNPISIFGWAKLGILNGYSDRFAYLEQYFDKAYTTTNGVATAASAGVLSPYGEFLPTLPGPAALVTLPDLDTGQRGTGVVQVVKLQTDVDHNLKMDLSFGGPDNTSIARPLSMWVNNDFDRPHTVDITDREEDDLLTAGCPYTPQTATPDYAYRDATGHHVIPCNRDLEDYARLWIPGVSNIMAVMPATYAVRMKLIGDGAIRLFRAIEADGGTNYLFDEVTASNQVNNSASLYVGLLTSASPIILTNQSEHFIWCGAQRGSAEVHLQIFNGTNLVADTAAYFELKDIKEMWFLDVCNG